jgi:glycerophosphoryl diester phosphodiesterase
MTRRAAAHDLEGALSGGSSRTDALKATSFRTFAAAALMHAALAVAPLAQASLAPVRPLAERPFIIAHGGASGYLPEDTMGAFALAVGMGADFIQPTLYMTGDGAIVARHQRELEGTTDIEAVAAFSPDLKARRKGASYHVDALRLDQLRLLRSRTSRGSHGATPGNGHFLGSEAYGVATLDQVLDYVHVMHRLTGRVIGLYLEIGATDASADAAYASGVVEAIAAALARPKYGGLFDGGLGNVFLKASDPAIARRFRARTGLPVVVEVACHRIEAVAGSMSFDAISVSPDALLADPACVARAHEAGLLVHAEALVEDPVGHAVLLAQGVDGVYATHPDVGKLVRDSYYPLIADPVEEESSWRLARGGEVSQLHFAVRNPFGGARSHGSIAAILEFRLTQLPSCSSENEERLAHEPLEISMSQAPVGRWTITWRMPVTTQSCFRGAAILKDGTRVETYLRTS